MVSKPQLHLALSHGPHCAVGEVTITLLRPPPQTRDLTQIKSTDLLLNHTRHSQPAVKAWKRRARPGLSLDGGKGAAGALRGPRTPSRDPALPPKPSPLSGGYPRSPPPGKARGVSERSEARGGREMVALTPSPPSRHGSVAETVPPGTPRPRREGSGPRAHSPGQPFPQKASPGRGGGRDAAGGKPGFSSLTAAEAGDSGYIRESSSVRWQYCGKVLPRYKKKDCYTQRRVYEKASPSASGPPSPWSAHGAVGMGTSVNSIAKLGCTPAQLSVQTAVCFKIIKS